MYSHCLVSFKCVHCVYTKLGIVMNLRAAQKELRGRSPEVTFPVLALEALVIVAVGWILVGVFA